MCATISCKTVTKPIDTTGRGWCNINSNKPGESKSWKEHRASETESYNVYVKKYAVKGDQQSVRRVLSPDGQCQVTLTELGSIMRMPSQCCRMLAVAL